LKRAIPIFAILAVGYAICIAHFCIKPVHCDEGRYVTDSRALLQIETGKLQLSLWSGPGYPLVLVPLSAMSLPLTVARVANAFFLFGALIALFASFRRFMADGPATAAAFLVGMYPPLFNDALNAQTEVLTFLLISLCALCVLNVSKNNRLHKPVALAAIFAFAFLALTKILFGYVLLVALVVSAGAGIVFKRKYWMHMSAVLLGSLIVCAPWLGYTWSKTGKVFYWGTPGELSLYWMSTPFSGEYGDWHAPEEFAVQPELALHHKAFFDSLSRFDPIRRNNILRSTAIHTIMTHPAKYAGNVALNMGRMLFSFPFSYTPQKTSTLVFVLSNLWIVAFFPVALIATLRRWHSVPDEIKLLLLLVGIAFGGSALMSAYVRQFTVLTPVVFIWFAFVNARLINVRLAGFQSDAREDPCLVRQE
jgi:hypothetical protein